MTALDHANNLIKLTESFDKECTRILIKLNKPRHLRTLRSEKFSEILDKILIEQE